MSILDKYNYSLPLYENSQKRRKKENTVMITKCNPTILRFVLVLSISRCFNAFSHSIDTQTISCCTMFMLANVLTPIFGLDIFR